MKKQPILKKDKVAAVGFMNKLPSYAFVKDRTSIRCTYADKMPTEFIFLAILSAGYL